MKTVENLIGTLCVMGGMALIYKLGYRNGRTECANEIKNGMQDIYIEHLEKRNKSLEKEKLDNLFEKVNNLE